MKLNELTTEYDAYKQSMGMRFRTEARVLKSFSRNIGDVEIDQLEPDVVDVFLAGTGPVTRFWHRKYEVLSGFYRFAIARRHVDLSPLPRTVPKPPPPFVPHIYSRDELQRLLAAAESSQHARAKMEPHTCRTLLPDSAAGLCCCCSTARVCGSAKPSRSHCWMPIFPPQS
jgi:integrase